METRGSLNYQWNIRDQLGQGATGAVFKGRHKKTGETYAIKVSNNFGMMRPVEIRRREYDVLLKLHHENIVKIFATEVEIRGQNEIIVMELCSGGSLFTMLENPSNAYGLQEDEFKQVVKDVVAGMKHLREQGIVHRDLKPGNIMRVAKDDGSFVYKLTDFGAAKELEGSEEFMSIYGTEEYLHPDLYERGVLRKHGNKAFSATVDLWSIGVTFYHIATGQLPFRPYGGRQNKVTMYEITSKKKPGIISGVQKSEGEEIEWSDKLPEHTRLSQGLKVLFTPVLAGALESEPCSTSMSFEQFFASVQDILTRKVIDIYSVHSACFHKIYMKPNETFAKFQELIAVQTGVSARQQMLMFKYEEFRPDPMAPASSYPNTTEDSFMVMIGGDSILPDRLNFFKIPKMPNVPEEGTDRESDASVAKIMTTRAHYCKYAVELYTRATKAMLLTVESVIKNLKKVMMLYISSCKQVESQSIALNQTCDVCCSSHDHLVGIFDALVSQFTEPQDKIESLQEKIQTIKKWTDAKRQSEKELHKINEGLQQFRDLISSVVEKDRFLPFLEEFRSDTEKEKFFNLVSTYTRNTADIYTLFRKDKHQRRLTVADEQRHAFDRKKIVVQCEKITRVTDDALGQRSQLHAKLIHWLSEVDACTEEAENLQNSFVVHTEAMEAHRLSLQTLQEQCQVKSKEILQEIQQLQSLTTSNAASHPGSSSPVLNGHEEQEEQILTDTMQALGYELDTLSHITTASLGTAKDNTAQIERLVSGLIKSYESMNDHLTKNFEQLVEAVRGEADHLQ
ncbi:serine/threonine-protein kinase TBK1-like isoform X1 [Acropora millepora]|uniref:serine/threonine-protein kinase TBK1-like isoform X1 n=2 Tax=Acropora millepora TaxID=45264 RepID=UPI001CF1D8FE|nr:serine/threonine-protein kinase TBK1-like isoform X1 [Acropora millepora]XP_029201600.2 serine/threonine-protein kinase TBK1-like isoform X1 [Acropora millepora]XP_029201601.2 serine/threonine-protein kinase TBK1-like isoform X1 [Acropora millepora]XP_029201602.2 serine/threonine-protein kinase TBK1-like isoform X1 [Acropora millepora]